MPAERVQSAIRIFELGPGTQGWEEIDYSETSYFVHSAENFQFEVVFVLDFTNSMARQRLPDGRNGLQAMLEAFEKAVTDLPRAHRIGAVEFHDRSVEPGILSTLTTDHEAVLSAVSQFANSNFEPGSSRMWDSIQRGSELLTSPLDNPDVVRALIFISDGRDTSSVLVRSDVGALAIQDEIQLYALGVGDVFEEEELAVMVLSTGGAYYPTRELGALQEQLREVISDLRGQYQLTYLTLRRQGTYRTRIEIDLPEAVGLYESPDLDVATFFGADIEGRIVVDPPSLDKEQGTAQVFIRALHVPRNIDRIRFRVETVKQFEPSLVSSSDGGLVEDWELSDPDLQGFYEVSRSQPLEFGESGLLFHLALSGVTERSLEIPFAIDNSIYTGGKSFSYPESFFIGERILAAGRIAFRSKRDGNSEIYMMNADGSQQTNLTNHPDEDFLADWSPEGERLVFDSDRNIRRGIFLMNADGTGLQSLTALTSENALPAWSPGGGRIAFDSKRDLNREIYVMNADGTDQTRLTNNPADDWWASWSPDGSRILFTSNRDGDAEVYVMNANGTGQANLTNSPAGDFRPVWSPDGGTHRILLVPRRQQRDLCNECGRHRAAKHHEQSQRRLVPFLVP